MTRALVKAFKHDNAELAERIIQAMLGRGIKPAQADRELARALLGCLWEWKHGYPDRLAEVMESLAEGKSTEALFPDDLYADKPWQHAEEPKKIFHAACHIKDRTALAAIVVPIPDGDKIATRLREGDPGLAAKYVEERRTAYYIVSDGKVALCWTVTGISSDEAAAILSECDSITEWGDAPFNAAVERALGVPLQLVQ